MRYVTILLCLGLAACAKPERAPAAARDTLTTRQRDSVLGASRLPGAKGIQGALRAQDTAAAQAARADSIQ